MKIKPKNFTIKYNAVIKSQHADNNIKIWLVQPQNNKLQVIRGFKVNHKPKSFYYYKGNKILYFYFKNFERIDFEFKLNATLYQQKNNIKPADFSFFKNNKNKFSQYLLPEKYREQTKEAISLVNKICSKDDNNLQKTISLFNFVVNKFEYCYPVKNRGVKNLKLSKLKGDWAEYASLFVAFCRILGLPAENQTGFVIYPKQKTVAEHGWASVYLPKYGWVDADPQYASLEKTAQSGLKKYFCQRSDYRIVFSNGFNFPLKPRLTDKYKFDFWLKQSLPMSKSYVQTLQPLTFASLKEVKFKDEIELI